MSDFRQALRRKLSLAALLLPLLASSCALMSWLTAPPIDVQVMCFNIRNGHGKDGDNRWELRRELVCETICAQAPDVIGLQEVYHFQLNYLLEHMPQYGALGVGRDGGINGEYSPIFYLKERFEMLDYDTFWLSDTPTLPSATWGNRYRRLCTWAHLKDLRTEKSFYVYNTHLDHESQSSRENSVRLIMQAIAARVGQEPFVLCGDFNATEDSRELAYLKGEAELEGPNPIPLRDSWRVVHPHEPESGTVSHFTGSREPYKIDYILVTPKTQVSAAEILRENREGRYPSDHYPVTAHLHLK